MQYDVLIGSFIYLVSGSLLWWQVFKTVRLQKNRIDELERIILRQRAIMDANNSRQVGLLAAFEMLLRKLEQKIKN